MTRPAKCGTCGGSKDAWYDDSPSEQQWKPGPCPDCPAPATKGCGRSIGSQCDGDELCQYEKAMSAINALYSDTSVSKGAAIINLETLIGEIRTMIDSLKGD